MKRLPELLATLFRAAVHWFEYGDLVPLLVLVSAVHYASVLAGKDQWIVAVAIGMLVDLGHFRTVRAAVRYSAPKRKVKRKGSALVLFFSRISERMNAQTVARWLIAAGMTAVSLAYHERYYKDLWLSAPLPLLIAALAWLQRVDQGVGVRKPTAQPAQVAPSVREVKQELPAPAPVEALPAPTVIYQCEGCERVFGSQQALAAHTRHCKPALSVRSNGHHTEVPQ